MFQSIKLQNMSSQDTKEKKYNCQCGAAYNTLKNLDKENLNFILPN